MGREDYKYIETPLTGGINQAFEVAKIDECADSRNMWAPRGKLEQRPGFVGRYVLTSSSFLQNYDVYVGAANFYTVIVENPIGTFTITATLAALPVGSRYYFGVSPFLSDNSGETFDGIIPQLLTAGVGLYFGNSLNANDVSAYVEYWDGNDWKYITTTEINRSTGLVVSRHLGVSTTAVLFSWPLDMGLLSLDFVGQPTFSGQFFRLTIVSLNGGTQLGTPAGFDTDAQTGVLIDNTALFSDPVLAATRPFFLAARFRTSTRYLRMIVRDSVPSIVKFMNIGQLSGAISSSEIITLTDFLIQSHEPPTLAVVPETDEAFVAYSNLVTVHRPVPSSDIIATVETGDFAVGPNAPYNKDFVGQRTDFPQAKYIYYFGSRLWFVTDTSVSWSAATPFHKVLPLLSEESLIEPDNTVTTGVSSLGENVVVFKERSIWILVFDG